VTTVFCQYPKSLRFWLLEKASLVLAWLQKHDPDPVIQANDRQCLATPLRKADLPFLKRVATIGIIALALHVLAISGLLSALIVPALCIGLALMVHRFVCDRLP
jgi:hypothetical protein